MEVKVKKLTDEEVAAMFGDGAGNPLREIPEEIKGFEKDPEILRLHDEIVYTRKRLALLERLLVLAKTNPETVEILAALRVVQE